MERESMMNLTPNTEKKKWQKPSIEIIGKNIIESGIYLAPEGENFLTSGTYFWGYGS